MAKFCEVLSKYQQNRIFIRIAKGEYVGNVFGDYINFFGNMPLTLVFTQMRNDYEQAGKPVGQFAKDFLDQIDENVNFGCIDEINKQEHKS